MRKVECTMPLSLGNGVNINLNDYVLVELTSYGAKRLNDINKQITEIIPNHKPILHSEGEIYKAQLWNLFSDFGNMIYLGSTELPFKNNIINIGE